MRAVSADEAPARAGAARGAASAGDPPGLLETLLRELASKQAARPGPSGRTCMTRAELTRVVSHVLANDTSFQEKIYDLYLDSLTAVLKKRPE